MVEIGCPFGQAGSEGQDIFIRQSKVWHTGPCFRKSWVTGLFHVAHRPLEDAHASLYLGPDSLARGSSSQQGLHLDISDNGPGGDCAVCQGPDRQADIPAVGFDLRPLAAVGVTSGDRPEGQDIIDEVVMQINESGIDSASGLNLRRAFILWRDILSINSDLGDFSCRNNNFRLFEYISRGVHSDQPAFQHIGRAFILIDHSCFQRQDAPLQGFRESGLSFHGESDRLHARSRSSLLRCYPDEGVAVVGIWSADAVSVFGPGPPAP